MNKITTIMITMVKTRIMHIKNKEFTIGTFGKREMKVRIRKKNKYILL